MQYLVIELGHILKKNFFRIEEFTMKNCGIYFEKQNQKWFSLWLALGIKAKIILLVILSINLVLLSILTYLLKNYNKKQET